MDKKKQLTQIYTMKLISKIASYYINPATLISK